MNCNTAIGWMLAILLAEAPALGWAVDTASAAAVESQAASAQPAEEKAAPAAGLQVVEAAVATGMENRVPQGAAESFPAGTQRLYCYTKLTGGKPGDEITHKWLKGKEVMAEVNLKIGGSPWRTFSTKGMMQEDTGAWTVEVRQGDAVLKNLSFKMD